jgi:ectoine hydroxylase-related dioxygenase (phytanoyl-CoA dioxygenase family)
VTTVTTIPTASYGILRQNQCDTVLDEAAEQVRHLGYAVIDAGYTADELQGIAEEFNRTRASYVETHGETTLKRLNELHTIRSPLTHGGAAFLNLALNSNLLSMLKRLIAGQFILNQQNGIINPPQEAYNQGAWHRDLPYQHFVSSQPLAIKALFCVDDFTFENGATFVLPASHKAEAFPSASYIQKNAVQVVAKAGSFILLDCMVFHTGGFNSTMQVRRAVNHVYNIPFFKQQINIPMNMVQSDTLSAQVKELLGFKDGEPASIIEYHETRNSKL